MIRRSHDPHQLPAGMLLYVIWYFVCILYDHVQPIGRNKEPIMAVVVVCAKLCDF